MSAVVQSGSQGVAGPGSCFPEIPDQIRKLGELRDSGLLTAEEFETKKAELLKRV